MSPLALSLRLLQAQPDERLVALARRGHEPAFEALVRRYRRRLLAYCRKLVAPQASAEDILQQALMQAWSALAGGAEVHDARAWLYRIVHNAAISATRKVGEDPAQLSRDVIAVEVDLVVEQRLAAREALAGLAALPELQREVMLGTAVEGRSHEEVAASLGITSGSVRGLLYRARSTLRSAAAALIPAPMIEWAIRQQQQTGRAGAAGMVEAIAGGGSAGVAGAVIKGGAVVTVAGALAGTAAVVVTHRFHVGPEPGHAAVAHRTVPKRRIVALVGTPVASARDRDIYRTPASAAATRLEPVRLVLGGHHARPSAAVQKSDARQPAKRLVSRQRGSGSDRAAGAHRGPGPTRSDGGDGSRPPDRQGTGSAAGGASGSGVEGTAASATESGASNYYGDASAGKVSETSMSQPDYSAGAAPSQGTPTTTTQSSQPAPSPPGTGTGAAGSEY